MTKLEKAKQTLVHYFRILYKKADIQWDGDNSAEIEGVVDDIAAGIRREIEEQQEADEEVRQRIRDAREGRG